MPQDMNEEGLQTMFSKYGAIRFCKLMRSATGASLDFGFVEFVDYRCAQAAQILLNGRHIGENVLRVSYDIGNSKQEKHANLYVARLPLTVDEGRLLHMFSVFGSIESVKVIRNRETNISRGIAFVRFDALQSAVMAVEALHNTIPNGFFRPMEVKYVNPNHKGKLDRGPPRRHNLNRPDPSYTNSFKMNMVPSWVLQTFPIDPCTENQDLSEQHSKRPNEEPEEDEDFDCKRPCGFYYDDSN
ncbi:hypothetical protein KR018_012624 [Drosophila ironensis]|nr:hypothetical protein KR018_012624 [Drosophila ironensis]